jgi:hypothetical protein
MGLSMIRKPGVHFAAFLEGAYRSVFLAYVPD